MFENQVALVTGAASGIGKALSERLATRGARVAVVDLRLDAAQAVAEAIGGGARGYACDVADHARMQDLAAEVRADLGVPTLVFANAGVATGGTIVDTDPKEFQWMFDVNVGGVFNTIQAFVPGQVTAAEAGGRAHFVITGSENSVGVPPTGPTSIYTATKHALLGLADTLRRDVKQSGVGVTLFCPSVVNTRLWDSASNRQDVYGGSAQLPAEVGKQIAQAMELAGLPPELTAQLTLEGVERGDFLVITDARIRAFAEPRLDEIRAALDLVDERLAELGVTTPPIIGA
ncbi:SDR family oxidoreductase [Cryptosporangium aurantiacum]|uniref:Short-chain dehydrogenase n=1 Tax=Cryptosporangium aurantiacum TaxID=134849 RepID=A0A1M7RNV9_9ACTN|nr:SDR family NAD(P)-dependent oxidoreductase [Cryptosporangium aurantiacum]SHN47944.1 Short-chain dehydrogenase [Cryptosporangium aurantiacum]